jgi:hypothetical protein
LAIVALFIVCLVIFNVVSLTQEVRQKEATHATLTHHATTQQHAQSSPFFRLDTGFIYDLFSFHCFTPDF